MTESFTRVSAAAAFCMVASIMPAAAQQCPELAGAIALESVRYRLAYRTVPEQIVVGRHFVVEMVVCPKGDHRAPDSVRVDAHMPEHRHGMNYRPSIQPGETGRYRAEGLLFHMPGRWEFIFEIGAAGKADRLTRDHSL